jgi:hypothetical protein
MEHLRNLLTGLGILLVLGLSGGTWYVVLLIHGIRPVALLTLTIFVILFAYVLGSAWRAMNDSRWRKD